MYHPCHLYRQVYSLYQHSVGKQHIALMFLFKKNVIVFLDHLEKMWIMRQCNKLVNELGMYQLVSHPIENGQRVTIRQFLKYIKQIKTA